MDDYISKRTAIETALTFFVEYLGGAFHEDLQAILKKRFEEMPSADVVEVVRCKDCKYYQFADNRAFGFPVKRCEWTGFEDVDDDDYCSCGERKDGDTDG